MMVSNAAAKARESARRSDGKFGVQQKQESGLSLSPGDDDFCLSQEMKNVYVDEGENTIETYTDEMGNLNREYLPAMIIYRPSGEVEQEIYARYGVLQAVKGYHEGGQVALEEIYEGGQLHSYTHPAKVTYDENGVKTYEEWRVDGVLHRVGGPARVTYWPGGKVARASFYQAGQLLIIRSYDENGREVTYETDAVEPPDLPGGSFPLVS